MDPGGQRTQDDYLFDLESKVRQLLSTMPTAAGTPAAVEALTPPPSGGLAPTSSSGRSNGTATAAAATPPPATRVHVSRRGSVSVSVPSRGRPYQGGVTQSAPPAQQELDDINHKCVREPPANRPLHL